MKYCTVNFDIEQKSWIDYYTQEISLCINKPISESEVDSIRASLAAHINLNNIQYAYQNMKHGAKQSGYKVLMIEDRAFFAYAHGRIFNSLGMHVTHTWNQHNALGLDLSIFDLILISESQPAINVLLFMNLINLIPGDKRPLVFVITDKNTPNKYADIISMKINEFLRKPLKSNEVVELLRKYKLIA